MSLMKGALVASLLLIAITSSQAQSATSPSPLDPSAISATLPETTDKQTGILLPNPVSPKCEVGIDLKFINTSLALQDPSQPTASPVPAVVQGNLSLQIVNLQGAPQKGPYVVTVEVPVGTLMANVSGATMGNPAIGSNNTLSINFTMTTPLSANAGNHTFLNVSVLASSQDFNPRAIYLNGAKCAIGLVPNITVPNTLPNATSAGNNNLSSFVATGYVTTSGNRIVGVDGNPIYLNGANWFGFETGANMVDGLYAGDSTLTADLATVAYRIQLLGFNAIRLPFSFLVLFQATPTIYTRQCRVSSQDEIRSNVIDPRDAASIPSSAQPPSIVAPPATFNSGVCNDYVPNESVYQRFLYVVGYLARQGFYILIDNHANTDPTIVNNPATWLAQWTSLMRDITNDPPSKARVMVDILNEPDSRGLGWDVMGQRYLEVMDAVYEFSPTTLFFIEGTKQAPIQMNWGDGFVTDGNIISQYGLSDPRPFFDTVLTRPYLNNVVISPHYYGPSVSQATSNYLGTELAFRASVSWGYLAKTGYGGHIFPTVIGETGTQLIIEPDLAFFRDFGLYLTNQGALNDGQHLVTKDLFWWSWNSNSGDTGGLVDTTWVNVLWNKTQYLETNIGLQPWSLLAASGALQPPSSPSPTPPSPAPTTPSPAPTTPSPAPTTPSPTPTAPTTPSPAPVSPSPPVSSPTPASPEPSPSPPPTAPPTPPTGSPCSAISRVDATWVQDGLTYAVFQLFLSNQGSTQVITPYSLSASNPAYTSLQSTWNWQATFQSGGTVSGTSDPSASWETLQPNSQNSVNVGGIITSNSGDLTSLRPQSVAVNGVACTVTN